MGKVFNEVPEVDVGENNISEADDPENQKNEVEIVSEIIVDKIGEINNEPVDYRILEKDETINELKIELCDWNCVIVKTNSKV